MDENGCPCNEGEGKSLNSCATEAFRLLCAKGYEQSGCSEHQKDFPPKIKERKSFNSQGKERLKSVTLQSALFFSKNKWPIKIDAERVQNLIIVKPNVKKMFDKYFLVFPML